MIKLTDLILCSPWIQENSNPVISGYGDSLTTLLRWAFVSAGINTTSAAWDWDGHMIRRTTDRLGWVL